MFSKNFQYPYIIAEIGSNHNGSIEVAKRLVDEAKKAGCNAVKFQLWGKDTAHTKSYIKKLNKQSTTLDGVKLSTKELGLENVEQQLEAFSFGREEHLIMKDYCDKVGIDFSSTCLTEEDIDFLIEIGVVFIKVASQDLNHTTFLNYIAKKKMPTILSTGLGTLGEIENAVNCFRPYDLNNLILLHCISLYPPEDKDIHLKQMLLLKEIFGLPVGYSDHSLGFSISLAAVALGTQVIEKHFTLDKNMPGWDHYVSATLDEMKIICEESRRIVDSLGRSYHQLTEKEKKKKETFRRSIVSNQPIKKGEIITLDKLFFKRPATSIAPDELIYVIGRRAKRDISEDKTLEFNDLE